MKNLLNTSHSSLRNRKRLKLLAPSTLLVFSFFLSTCSSGIETSLSSGKLTPEMEPAPLQDEAAAGSIYTERSFAGTTPAPEFPPGLDWLNTDRPLTIAELEGKVVILDFWTYGCINCMHVIPDLKRLEAEYPDELVVIGVHSAKFANESDTDNIRQIILRYDREHPVVNDKDFQVWRQWGATAWPTLIVVDPAGNVSGGHAGEGVYDLFKPVVESLVREFDARGEIDRTPLDWKLESEGLPTRVLSFPGKVLADVENERLIISDTNHNRILIAHPESGEILNMIGTGEEGFSDGPFNQSDFNSPQGLALSEDGNVLYIADTENHAIREADLRNEAVTTLAGTGQQSRNYPPLAGSIPDVELNSPWALELNADRLFISMAGSHQLFAIDLESGYLQPIAGSGREGTLDGLYFMAELAQPSGLAYDGDERLYFADSEGSSIRWVEIDGEERRVGTLAGSGESLFDFGDSDGFGSEARLQHPLGLTFYDGLLYVADTYNHKIKVIDPGTEEVRTLAGGGSGWQDGNEGLFYEPGGLDADDGRLFIADTNNHAVRVLDLDSGETNTLVLSGIEDFTAVGETNDFFGETVTLPSTMLKSGVGLLRLGIELPDGYKLNELTPSSVVWKNQEEHVTLEEQVNALTGLTFPVEFPATFTSGTDLVSAELNLYYCEENKESLCFYEPVLLRAPVTISDEGSSSLEFSYTLPLPEGIQN